MSYKMLPFDQYFLDTAEDYNHSQRSFHSPEYQSLRYPCGGKLHKLLGLQHEVNYALCYDPDRDAIQINFEKTMGFTDWFANLEFEDEYYDAIDFEGQPLQLWVHRGWAEMYLAVKRIIRTEWQRLHEAHASAETEIIGWSLGSGQAMLCAQDLNYNFGLRARVYTYGSVKPFRAKGAAETERLDRYLAGLCVECRNFAEVNDVITYMPPFKGFRDLHRVTVALKPRSFWRLVNPWRYHTCYDNASLYRELPKE